MNFAKFSLGAFALTAMLVACDSDSASAKDTEIEELSSSSAVEIASSSSTIRNDNSSSSSETTQSSSSSENISAGSVYDATAKTLKDLRDGKTYKTVVIGEQTWMAENLNYAYTGVPYKVIGSYVYTFDSTSWCYENDPANCTKYGRLYTWAAAMDSVGTWSTNGKGCGYLKICLPIYPVRGVCPEGWHLPTQSDWNTLFTAVGGVQDEDYAYRWNGAGTVLKSTSGWNVYEGITNEDSFGFSALPAGYRNRFGDYYDEGRHADFWSSTENNSIDAYRMYLYYDYDAASLFDYYKYYGFSVRCVKD